MIQMACWIKVSFLGKLTLERRFKTMPQKRKENTQPSIAPGMNAHDDLEKKATEEEIAPVTRLYLDRTPND
ncbi:hypothetical protein [Ferviditalea candida]|uniref:Uncharacterized protein n=1 Tax=Ferviditalea candida TaxID=3108399 RepID=A0ABU5ZGV9_9BACL|nr:hypothetical protein [Paenibacillaceae bacterium T2]